MKVLMFYRPNSEHDTKVQGYAREFNQRTTKTIDLVDLNTREGDAKARMYGIERYPSIVATSDDGAFLKMWQDEMLPLIDEVSYYDSR